MVEKAAKDYAKIFRSVNMEEMMQPVSASIDDMLTRLDEFETLLSKIKAESGTIIHHIRGIQEFSDNFETLMKQIDRLETLTDVVIQNLDEVENTVDIAEEELNIPDYSLRGVLLKPLMAKTADTSTAAPRTNLKNGEFQRVQIFNSNDYFGDPDMSVQLPQIT